MDRTLEVELFPALEMLPGKGGIPARLSPPAGRLLLVFVASGLRRAALILDDGRVAFRATGRVQEAAMLMVPPGAVFESEFGNGVTEAYVFDFSCPGIRMSATGDSLVLESARGTSARAALAVRLTAYDVAVLRPMAERVFRASFEARGGARHLRGCLFMQAMLGHFVSATGAQGFSDPPEHILFKEIEASPRAFTVKNAARRMGFSCNGLSRLFMRKFHGATPTEVKTKQSMHLAKHYLLETTLPFKAVAARLGFSSQSYFTQFVKRNSGRTPREIRAEGKWFE